MRILGKVLYLILAAGIIVLLAVAFLNIVRGTFQDTFQDHPELSVFTKLTLILLVLGITALVTGAGMNALARFIPPRPDNDWGIGGIDDKVWRRYGPPTWRIGVGILLLTLPMLVVAIWITK